MNLKKSSLLVVLALALVWSGCAPDTPSAPEVTGRPEVAGRVLSLGNSLTAGFMNGGLRIDGQRAGFANLVANQIVGSDQTLPLINVPGVGSSSTGDPTLAATPFYVTPTGALAFDTYSVADIPGLLLAAALPGPYDNLGVPGATTLDVTNATSSANSQSPGNSFFDLILRNSALPPGDTTQMDQLEALANGALPTPLVMTLWIGNNDVLGGATGGDPVVGTNVTPPTVFETLLNAILTRVDALNVPMVAVANIPSITSAPYFTAVPPAIPGAGAWNTDETDVQLVLLPAQNVLFNPDGSPNSDYLPGGSSSLPSNLTLTLAEVVDLGATVDSFNGILAAAAAARGWALIDINAALAALPADPSQPATLATLNAAFPLIPGFGQNVNSAFSLDGIHPSEKGYARVANEFLGGLNATYGMSFPTVDEASVVNSAGWEEFGGGTAVARPIGAVSAQGLASMAEFFGAR